MAFEDIRKKSQYVYFNEEDKSIVEEIKPIELDVSPFQLIMYSDKGPKGLHKVGFSEFINLFGTPEKTSHITKKQQFDLVKTGNKIYVFNVSGVDQTKVQSFGYSETDTSITLSNTVDISILTEGDNVEFTTDEFSLLKIYPKYFGTYVNTLRLEVDFTKDTNNSKNLVTIKVYKLINGIETKVEEMSGYLEDVVNDKGESLNIMDIQSMSKYISVLVNKSVDFSKLDYPILDVSAKPIFNVSFVTQDSSQIPDKVLSATRIEELLDTLDEDSEFKYFVEQGMGKLTEVDSSLQPSDISSIRMKQVEKCEQLMQVYYQDFFGINDINVVKSNVVSMSSYTQQFYPDIIKPIVYGSEVVYEPFPVSVEVQKISQKIDELYGQYYPASGMLQKIPDQIDLTQKIRKQDRDELYSLNINPISKIFNEGIFVWGNKTTKQADSKLEQLHVRRLINFMIVKPLKSRLLPYIFKPMTPSMITEISNIVRDLQLSLKGNQVDDMTYKIQTIGTQVQITLNIKPVNQIEYITVNMIVLPSEGITIEG